MAKWKDKLQSFFTLRRLEKWAFISFFIIAFLGGVTLGAILISVESGEALRHLESFRPELPTRIFDKKGRLITELFEHKRELVHLNEIPRPVIAAFLAVEDNNFFEHFGIDFGAILRAAWANLKAGKIVQGGSTLTQQLVKGLYTKGEKTLWRKIYEAVVTLQVEKEFSKEEILEMYFNQIYLGHGAYGIASAARFYFNKPVKDLNVVEGAILAALPKAPHTYSPFRSPHRSRKRNYAALMKMVELGYLKKEDAIQLYHSYWSHYWKKILVTPTTANLFGLRQNKAPYFTEFVRQELEGLFGKETVYRKGLQVYTTLDLDQLAIAKKALLKTLKKADPIARRENKFAGGGIAPDLLQTYRTLQSVLPLPSIVRRYSLRNDFREKFKKRLSLAYDSLLLLTGDKQARNLSREFMISTRDFKSDLKTQGAFLAMEKSTGRITVMIGGREFKASDQFNRAVQARRQPGSAFKPFVYGAALEDRAVHSNMGFLDSPVINIQQDGTTWAPGNYGGGFHGYVLLTRALQMSLNLVSVQLYDMIGPDKIINFASRLTKVDPSRFQPNPSLALGSSELTPWELMQGYAVIANLGKDVVPHTILYVTDRDGNVLLNHEKEIFRILSYKKKHKQLQIIEKAIAYILHKMMEGVVSGGTAHRGVRQKAHFYGVGAGKTGTTSGWHDAWFGGWTPDMLAVVWIGLDNGRLTLGRHQAGGTIATPVWGRFMKGYYKLIKKAPPKSFHLKRPKGVRVGAVCKYTGGWPNDECDTKENLVSTYIPAPIKKHGRVYRVLGKKCDCVHVETKSFLELLKEKVGATDEELKEDTDGKVRFKQWRPQ
ncbi:MAG: PBP1A family penicillin-binding protein [Candidatus Hydrogenedentota bacterium]|nr:MAG: PBP1A family penicillin-binding protein [Candidatus Hydrogenedentota bacterium]